MAGKMVQKDKRLTQDPLTKQVQSPVGYVFDFVADSADGSIPGITLDGVSGFFCGVDYIPDTTTPPNTITITIQQIDGVQRASGVFTAAGFLAPDDGQYVPFAGGLKIAIPASNTTNSAKGRIVLLVA